MEAGRYKQRPQKSATVFTKGSAKCPACKIAARFTLLQPLPSREGKRKPSPLAGRGSDCCLAIVPRSVRYYIHSISLEGSAMKPLTAVFEDDWSIITKLLPDQWRDKAKELGALQRFRAFPDVDSLLRTLLDHVAQGYSFRNTAMRAKWLGCASVSDVAVWRRLKSAGTWLCWLAEGVMSLFVSPVCWPLLGEGHRLQVAEGTTVQEPGSKGISWRLHYAINLPSLMCTEVLVTRAKVGESFKRFKIGPGEVWMGDRGFGHATGVAHVVIHGGDVIVRVNLTNIPFQDRAGQPFPLLERLQTLSPSQFGDWEVSVPHAGALIPGRICAKKLSEAEQERAVRKCRRKNGKKGKVRAETLEAARYIFIFTTLDRSISAQTVLSCYEARWQIEIVFKRLKSLLQLGHLRKKNTETARAWIHAKLLLTFLIEAIQRAARAFPPSRHIIARRGNW